METWTWRHQTENGSPGDFTYPFENGLNGLKELVHLLVLTREVFVVGNYNIVFIEEYEEIVKRKAKYRLHRM